MSTYSYKLKPLDKNSLLYEELKKRGYNPPQEVQYSKQPKPTFMDSISLTVQQHFFLHITQDYISKYTGVQHKCLHTTDYVIKRKRTRDSLLTMHAQILSISRIEDDEEESNKIFALSYIVYNVLVELYGIVIL